MSENAVVLDDEMPSAPVGEENKGPAVDGAIDASLFDGVGKMGEVIPVGTYHFRLQQVHEGWSEPQKGDNGEYKDPDVARFGKQPWFNLDWRCQQEPHTGRRVTEMVFWCSAEVFAAASAGDPTARKMVRSRLTAINDLLAAANMKPTGIFNIKDFFATNPEVKLQLKLTEKKTKDDKGKYTIKTGEQDNGVVKHISLTRPA